jgi:hypothetical protein
MDLNRLRQAAEEAGYLVARGYPALAVAAFVAEHRSLSKDEQALLACSTRLRAEYAKHIARELEPEDLAKRPLRIDASSVLAAVDAGLAGRTLLESPAGVLADPGWQRSGGGISDFDVSLARVESAAAALRPSLVRWYVDASAPWASRLAEQMSAKKGKRKVEVELVPDAGAALDQAAYVASSDPGVLDGAACWANLVARALDGVQAPRVRLEG